MHSCQALAGESLDGVLELVKDCLLCGDDLADEVELPLNLFAAASRCTLACRHSLLKVLLLHDALRQKSLLLIILLSSYEGSEKVLDATRRP